MSDPRNSDPTEQPTDLEIDLPENGRLLIDAGHDVGHVVLEVETYIEPEEMDRGNGMISLSTAEMVKVRDYLDELIRRDVELARGLLADPETTEESRTAGRRVLAAVQEVT